MKIIVGVDSGVYLVYFCWMYIDFIVTSAGCKYDKLGPYFVVTNKIIVGISMVSLIISVILVMLILRYSVGLCIDRIEDWICR